MNNVFAVAKSFITAKGVPDYAKSEYCYLSISEKHGYRLNVKELTSEEAKKIIISNNMVKVLENDYGSVFELLDLSFKKECKKLGIKS